ncbi:MAG: glycoside hydrolase family 1 protein [Candidatus Hodarchaeota archaeon]
MSKRSLTFPKGFLWGTATSAHQIEGSNKNNQWWLFEQQDGRIRNNDSAEVACDHWNRFEEDFALLTKFNQKAYRFSVEWSRIFPESHQKDSEAIEHYHKMLDALLARKIIPFLTLHHFTHPIWWEQEGGLKNQKPGHLEHFRQFCETAAKEFGEKVRYWNTINEIEVVAIVGFYLGKFPPGETNLRSAIRATNTLLKMHTLAYHTVKKIQPAANVGLVKNINIFLPANRNSRQDRLAARFADYHFNGSIFRALKTGKLVWSWLRGDKQLKESTDFIGLNYYNFNLISRRKPELTIQHTSQADPKLLCAGLEWEPYPEGLLDCLRRLQKEFPKLPIYITENGIGTDDDAWRQRYLIDHLKMVHQASEEGIDVRGYFWWSLMDNWEWCEGYMSRFGLVHVDYATQQRTIKESGFLYADIAKHNGLTSEILTNFPREIYAPEFPWSK